MAGNVISYKNIKRNAQKNKIANFTIWIWLPSSEMTKNRQKKNLALAICSIFLSFYPACAGPKGLRTSHFDFSIFSKLQVPWVSFEKHTSAYLWDQKKWHFWWQNQISKTTFIVQTFPKYCRKGFYFIKLSVLSPILTKYQFCWFSGLFWVFFPCKKCKK